MAMTYTWGADSGWAGQIFIGESIDDEMVKGVWTYQNEVVKEGTFSGAKLNGFGTCTYASGKIMEGNFREDRLYGYGKIKIPRDLLPDAKETETLKLIDNYWVWQGVFSNGEYLMVLS